jgi:anthrone oxygenase-like protein
MSTSLRLATAVMLVPAAIWAGIIVCYAVERVNLWRRMPLNQYGVDFRRSLHRVDPLQPILLIVAAAGTVWFALTASDEASTFAWLGIVGLAIVMVSSIVIAEPMNSRFRKLPEGELPPDADGLRARWERFHLVRTVVAMATLICLVLSTTYA